MKHKAALLCATVLAVGGMNRITAAEAAGVPIAKAVEDYAPDVHLHPGDGTRPMNADDFIAKSELRWDHEGRCFNDEPIARPVNAKALATVPDENGNGGYRHQKKGGPFCRLGGRYYNSTEKTRPKSDGVAGGDGFYLNFDNDARGGEGTTAPVYYDFLAGRWITYWFFYGYNDWTVRFNHEGDWERVTVILDKSNRATAFIYSQHKKACRDDTPSGRPVSYAARGSHANYPKPGIYEYGNDDAVKSDVVWRTRDRLVPLAKQPWYGYGGGWGEVGEFDETTGPLGPHPVYKPSGPPEETKKCEE